MTTYTVRLRITLEREAEVEAECEDDAVTDAKNQWYDETRFDEDDMELVCVSES